MVATPAVLESFDEHAIASQAGTPVRSQYATPGAPRSQVPDAIQPHPPRTGGNLIDTCPWHLGLDDAERMLDPALQKP